MSLGSVEKAIIFITISLALLAALWIQAIFCGSKLLCKYSFHFFLVYIIIGLLTFAFEADANDTGMDWTKCSIVLLTSSAVILIILLLIQRPYFQRCLKRKRKRNRKHKLNLDEVLNHLYSNVTDNSQQTISTDEETRRILQTVCKDISDKTCYKDMEILLAGSTAEQFSKPTNPEEAADHQSKHALLSDFDYMMFPQSHTVQFAFGDNGMSVYTGEFSPDYLGFVCLFDKNGENILSRNLKKKLQKVIKSSIQKNNLFGYGKYRDQMNMDTYHDHASNILYLPKSSSTIKVGGPAVQIKINTKTENHWNLDLTFSLKSLEWPAQISDWGTRPRKWPAESQVKDIVSLGCHIVPKSHKNDKKGATWRVSFSKAEVELSKLISPVARMCYIGLRMIHRDYFHACPNLGSYSLKCVFFYALEDTDQAFWTDVQNIQVCFDFLLGKVLECLQESCCPHYWIAGINLFENLGKNERKWALKRFETIRVNPNRYIEHYHKVYVNRQNDCNEYEALSNSSSSSQDELTIQISN